MSDAISNDSSETVAMADSMKNSNVQRRVLIDQLRSDAKRVVFALVIETDQFCVEPRFRYALIHTLNGFITGIPLVEARHDETELGQLSRLDLPGIPILGVKPDVVSARFLDRRC